MKVRLRSLTPLGTLLRVVRRFRFIDAVLQPLVRFMFAKSSRRARLNQFHDKMSLDEKGVFHNIFYKAFRGRVGGIEEGIWTEHFGGSAILLPIRPEMVWLDWEHSSAILGHDIEVKETYLRLLNSEFRPAVFFDIGANYGMHSLLFLSKGVKTISFEPNPNCKIQFETYCDLNSFEGEMNTLALGSSISTATLWFPENETWLGTIVEKTKTDHLNACKLTSVEVNLITLDDYVAKSGTHPDLIKIDAEGGEADVLIGASLTLANYRPRIIFECNPLNDKNDIWQIFADRNYAICTLPFGSDSGSVVLSREDFFSSTDQNFIGIHTSDALLSLASGL